MHGPGLLWSSFPCQAWSTAGKRKGAQDERNGWPWTVDWIDQVQPRWVIAENVRGLTFHRGEADCDDGAKPDDCPRCYLDGVILPQLRERFEWVDCRVLNSADYGTPQHRRRLFLVAGLRRISWPAPTHSEGGDLWTKPWRSMGEALGLTGSAVMQRGRDGTGGGTRDERRSLGEPCVSLSGAGGGSTRPWIEERNSGVRGWTRRDPSNPSNTLLTGVSPKKTGAPDVPYLASEDGKGVGPRRDGDAPGTSRRRLSVRECRILMNAPAIYDEALSLVTKTAAYRILGNGVDRRMSRLLAEAVMHAEQGL